MGILRIKTNDKEITIASATISTALAIAEKRTKDKQEIRNLVPREYHDYITLFEKEERKDLPPHRHNDHKIELDQTKDVLNKKLYSMKEKELEELRLYLGKTLSRRWIRESDSPVRAPILFVKKKDGSLRLCIDYRVLNAVTKKDRYPLRLIGKALDRLSTAKDYTKLHIKDAYHNIRIREGDEWKTAFKTRYGLCEYTVMPFGLTNAPATFQRWINSTLNRYLDICCLVYLDDILIYSNHLAQHKKDVRNIMETIRTAGMKLKPSKCEFHKNETEYLGFIINPDGVRADTVKTRAIEQWETPKTVKDIQCFTGFCNFYWRFMNGFSRIARSLYQLTTKKGKENWIWREKEQNSFNQMKRSLITAPVLVHFDPNKPIMVKTDTSNYVCSGILSLQQDDGTWRPVAYRSKTMSKAQCNYDIHDKELLAIMQALMEWRQYCEGAKYTVRILTDHKNLVPFTTTKELNSRQVRWSEELANFDINIEYRSVLAGGKPNALTGRSGDMPTPKDARKTQRNITLLPREKYWRTAIQLRTTETHQIQEKNTKELEKASREDTQFQEIRKALQTKQKELQDMALGLYQWRDNLL